MICFQYGKTYKENVDFLIKMKLFLLSRENVELAKGEAESLTSKGKLIDNILLIDTKKKTTRLAYTKYIAEVLFEANLRNIEEKIRRYNWNKLIKGTFAVLTLANNQHSQSLSQLYGGMIYDQLKKPKVDLENPDSQILIIKTNNSSASKYFICKQEWENEEKFALRSPKERPANLPITMLPKITRACVNLTGSTTNLYDPFCGTGGFLIEAGLMGLKPIGSDIEKGMIWRSKKNLEFYKIKKFKLFVQDALKINKKYEYIATDFPYGRNTKDITKYFYQEFIKILEKILKKRAVVIFPSFFDAKKLLKKSKLKIKGHYSYYLHKTLSREIYVLEK